VKPKYYLQNDSFFIENFNQAPTYADFFPAVAGMTGKPMWVFTTNRGQAIASFGVNDKNGSMIEFQPANKAFQSVSTLGFRTFVKSAKNPSQYFEPFSPQNNHSEQILITRPYELELIDRNGHFGLETNVVYFGLPNESIPSLVRMVTFKNISKKTLSLFVLDGIPRVVPYGMNDYLVKHMARTLEAFAEVAAVNSKIPLFKLKIEPDDKPQIKWLEAGFFSGGFSSDKMLNVITDPARIFGQDTSFLKPERFLAISGLPREDSFVSNILPASFFSDELRLKSDESLTWCCYYGFAQNSQVAGEFFHKVEQRENYASEKRIEMKNLIQKLNSEWGFKSGMSNLNTYADVTFMDNVLRGGFPVVLGTKGTIIHLYSRKHGDMERDYNNFQVSATYYSQGNGNFRDVNQNRRHDLFLNPAVGTENLEFFFNLIQLDGYNPLVIDPVKFVIPQDLLNIFQVKVNESCKLEYERLRKEPVLAGELYEFIKKYSLDSLNVDNVFRQVIDMSKPEHNVRYGEGYWIDHWTYNLDHLEQYFAVFPEKKAWLFHEKKDFTYYDSDHFVRPRREKYVITSDGRFRQYNAVFQDWQKMALLASRSREPNKVRIDLGKGEILKTTLLVKLAGLVAVKVATLDPFGVGIEMEADRPGWCDALNGAPGLFGSSTHEMFELARLVKILQKEAIPTAVNKTFEMPQEIFSLIREITHALVFPLPKDFRTFWDKLASARETFRQKTFLGVSGKTRTMKIIDLKNFLERVSQTLDIAAKKAVDPETKLPTSYFIHSVEGVELEDGWKQNLGKLPWKQRRVPPFLEGAVHAIKMAHGNGARSLYNAVRQSELRDKKLGMYKINAPLGDEFKELGRIKAFSPGWLENESIFLHMHYKFLLEILRAGLPEVYFKEIKTGLIPFQNPHKYCRPTFQNSSFIASSAFSNQALHGQGFVARLSGATSEFMSMIYFLVFGRQFFKEINGEIVFYPEPNLPKEWFTKDDSFGIGKDCFTLKIFEVPITYQNPRRKNTFGSGAVKPVQFEWILDGRFHRHDGRFLPPEPSISLREGRLESLSILLG